MRGAAIVGLAVALAGCAPRPRLAVDGAWVRLAAVPGRPAAAYFTLHGGPVDETLIDVSADAAVRSEMHESKGGGMAPLASVPVPAARDVAFAPGGRHVMLFDVNPGIRPGGRRIALTLVFADGTRLRTKAEAVGPAGAPPG